MGNKTGKSGREWREIELKGAKLIYHYDPVLPDPKAVTRNTQPECVHTHKSYTEKHLRN